MNKFEFVGEISASKSILNRYLIIQSYFPELKIDGNSVCDDIQKISTALDLFKHGEKQFDCGESGTGLRFLALRVSRQAGSYLITGKDRLLERPHQELKSIFDQIGVSIDKTSEGFQIISKGWKLNDQPIHINQNISSQFASALILNSWLLPNSVEIQLQGSAVSQGYLKMTIETCRKFGMNINENLNGEILIPADQRISKFRVRAESDLSSTFSIAALSVLSGSAEFLEFPFSSTQPDLNFVDVLNSMGAKIHRKANSIKVERPEKLNPIQANLGSSPDLFPVLSVLCAFAKGRSRLAGAPHLRHKESDRIKLTHRLLENIGIRSVLLADGLEIEGEDLQAVIARQKTQIQFDPDSDHRMAMAAGILQFVGFDIEIKHSEVVNKSFPEFWNILKENKR